MHQSTTCRRRPRSRRYKSSPVPCPPIQQQHTIPFVFFPVQLWLAREKMRFPASVVQRRPMASSRAALTVLLFSAFAAASAMAQLDEKFYSQSCPSVEDVVRKEMVRALSLAPSLAGPLLRMHFHDCFVRVRALPS
jgi:hypothetical protein